eukprot:359590-Chlamydomonas_euryale.AAC.3
MRVSFRSHARPHDGLPACKQGQPCRTCIHAAASSVRVQVMPPKITMRDFEKVLLRARPTVGKADLEVFVNFTTEFGEEAS